MPTVAYATSVSVLTIRNVEPTPLIPKVTQVELDDTYPIDVSNLSEKARRLSYEASSLPTHNDLSPYNRPYAKFRVAANNAELSYTEHRCGCTKSLELERRSRIGDGIRPLLLHRAAIACLTCASCLSWVPAYPMTHGKRMRVNGVLTEDIRAKPCT